MPSLSITNRTTQRFQFHYLPNTWPQRTDWVDVEPGETKAVVLGDAEDLQGIVDHHALYGMMPWDEAEEQGAGIFYSITDEEPTGVGTLHRKLHDEAARVPVSPDGEPQPQDHPNPTRRPGSGAPASNL